ncbi:hypothetical protein [Streptomyces hirsutus]|uniref:hypothetical protein n=1 Tax=Streptomyces hirsutus TaxID=35620 RepID=UPI0036AC230B
MALSINVFNSGYKPIPNPPGWTAQQQATWPASTSTLIAVIGMRRRRLITVPIRSALSRQNAGRVAGNCS